MAAPRKRPSHDAFRETRRLIEDIRELYSSLQRRTESLVTSQTDDTSAGFLTKRLEYAKRTLTSERGTDNKGEERRSCVPPLPSMEGTRANCTAALKLVNQLASETEGVNLVQCLKAAVAPLEEVSGTSLEVDLESLLARTASPGSSRLRRPSTGMHASAENEKIESALMNSLRLQVTELEEKLLSTEERASLAERASRASMEETAMLRKRQAILEDDVRVLSRQVQSLHAQRTELSVKADSLEVKKKKLEEEFAAERDEHTLQTEVFEEQLRDLRDDIERVKEAHRRAEEDCKAAVSLSVMLQEELARNVREQELARLQPPDSDELRSTTLVPYMEEGETADGKRTGEGGQSRRRKKKKGRGQMPSGRFDTWSRKDFQNAFPNAFEGEKEGEELGSRLAYAKLTAEQAIFAQAIRRHIKGHVLRRRFRLLVHDYTTSSASAKPRRRIQILKEVLGTERTYVSTLDKVEQEFLVPFQAAARNRLGFDEEDVWLVFSNIRNILALHRTFLAELRKECENDGKGIAPVFIEAVPSLKIYTRYVNNYPKALLTLNDPKKKHAFSKVMEDHDLVDLESLLITPIQRIPRYRLLLEDLLKVTSEEHIHYNAIQRALDDITQLADFLNTERRAFEKVVEVDGKMFNMPQPLSISGRKFLLEGNVLFREGTKGMLTSRGERTSERVLYLFTDALVMGKTKDKRIKFKGQIDLADIVRIGWMHDSPDDTLSNTFHIVRAATDDTLVFSSPTREEKIKWITSIGEAMEEVRRNERMAIDIQTPRRSLAGGLKGLLPRSKSIVLTPSERDEFVHGHTRGRGVGSPKGDVPLSTTSPQGTSSREASAQLERERDQLRKELDAALSAQEQLLERMELEKERHSEEMQSLVDQLTKSR